MLATGGKDGFSFENFGNKKYSKQQEEAGAARI
jgi:hypothetical protein